MRDLDAEAMGWRIRTIRNRRGMTQAELAKAAGLGESAVRSYELGNRRPKEKHIDAIAKALKVRPECFKMHEVNTPLELLYLLFHFESMRMVEPSEDGSASTNAIDRELKKGFRDWSRARQRYLKGEITQEEYEDWKDTYSNVILQDAWGKEIPDPYTGKFLEGAEREGAVHAAEILPEEELIRQYFARKNGNQ